MSRVTIKDLNGLLHAIEVMSDAVANGAIEQPFVDDAAHAGNCYDWVLAEIHRREARIRRRNIISRTAKETGKVEV